MREILLSFLATVSCASTNPLLLDLRPRQSQQLEGYIQEVRSVQYAISTIQVGNATTACGDDALAASLDTQGFNGTLSHLLICETAIGITIFPDIDQAAGDVAAALAGLQSEGNSTVDHSLFVSACQNGAAATLNDAGLDGDAIERTICSLSQQIQPSVTASSTEVPPSGTSSPGNGTTTAMSPPSTHGPSTTSIRNTTSSANASDGNATSATPITPVAVRVVTIFETVWINEATLSPVPTSSSIALSQFAVTATTSVPSLTGTGQSAGEAKAVEPQPEGEVVRACH